MPASEKKIIKKLNAKRGWFFDKPKKPFDQSYDWGLKTSVILSSILVLIYFIYPTILTNIISSIIVY